MHSVYLFFLSTSWQTLSVMTILTRVQLLVLRFSAEFGRESESAEKTGRSGSISLLIGRKTACYAPHVSKSNYITSQNLPQYI